MIWNLNPGKSNGRAKRFSSVFSVALVVAMATFILLPVAIAKGPKPGSTKQDLLPYAGDTCANATVINPASLPFTDESSTVGAAKDVDPGVSGCVLGLGPDVVYSFTPAATDIYTIGATPTGSPAVSFDISLYVITDCSNPAGTCVAGANTRGFGGGETVSPTLNAGTRYFIVVDSPNDAGQGTFHFALRRGRPANDSCASPTIIDPTRLPLTISGTTFGAHDDTNPGVSCLADNQSANGPDVVYQFTSNDSQVYEVTATPVGNFDLSLYIVTDCATAANCKGQDIGGKGEPDSVRRNLTNGSTYFIVVDGRQGDSGDFVLTMVPTIPRSPAAPTNLTAHAVSSTEIDLAWQDNSTNEAGFRIERSLDGASFSEIGQTASNVTTFNNTGLTPQTTYFYRVFAFNNFGNSDPSNIAADTTPPSPVPQFPVINVNPESIDFGTVRVTQSSTRTVTLSNAGGTDLVIGNISDATGPFSIVNKPALPLTLAPAASMDLSVRFTPVSVGTVGGLFAISSNDPQRPLVAVNLTGVGTGLPVPDLTITPSFIDFPGGSSVQLVTIMNTGDADLLVANIQPPRAPFSLSGLPPFPATLAPGDSFEFSLNFSAPAPGIYQGIMNVINNDPDQIVLAVRMRGTSTPQNEALKLRGPSQATVTFGVPNTLNVIAVNGTNTNITLSATSIPGGVFTDRGNGLGDLVLTPVGTTRRTGQVTFTARDTAGATKTLLSMITMVPSNERLQAQGSFTAPDTASNPPTTLQVLDTTIVPLTAGPSQLRPSSIQPAAAAGLAGYVIYRFDQTGQGASLGSIVAVLPASQTSFTDSIAVPPGTSVLTTTKYYLATAIYSTGTESSASNESSTAPRMVHLQFKKKSIRFQRANSNVEVGASLVVDGRESFVLTADGDLIVVPKSARSTPGNLRPIDIFSSGTHTVQVRNPHGQVSTIATL